MSPGTKAGLGAVVLLAAVCPSVFAQGFGKGRHKITLHRKLPAIAPLTGKTFTVRATARDARYSNLAAQLIDTLEAEITRNDHRFSPEKTAGDTVISCTINTVSTPPPTAVKRNVVNEQKIGKDIRKASEQRTFEKVSGMISVTYQARNRSGALLDTDNITAKFTPEYDDETGGAAAKSWSDMVKRPIKKILPGTSEESAMPQNSAELGQVLVSRVAAQVAMRVVNTDVAVPVMLAYGKGLDPAVKLAETGLYSRMLESLESMEAFPRGEDDAYRLYDVGVAYEALGYQAEDPKTAARFLDEAAIHYGKALDARPSEANFAEPQRRIEMALAHFKKIQSQPAPVSQAAPAPAPAPAPPSTKVATHKKAGPPPAPPKKTLSDVLDK
jgi:hypothetical protein